MEIDHIVEFFISKIISTDHDLEDHDLERFLIEHGNPKETSVYVTLFTPIILGRIICETLNVNFEDTYIEHLQDGTERKGFLSKNHFYIEIYKSLKAYIRNNFIDEKDIFKIAFRSPEFKLLNDFIQKNTSVNDIKFSHLHINW